MSIMTIRSLIILAALSLLPTLSSSQQSELQSKYIATSVLYRDCPVELHNLSERSILNHKMCEIEYKASKSQTIAQISTPK